MAQRAPPPRLSVPPLLRPSQSARFYPSFTPTPSKAPFFRSPTPTPSKRPRAPEGPLWLLTLLDLLSSYAVYKWLAGIGTAPPLVVFTFLALLGSAVVLAAAHRPWSGRPVLPLQWGFLIGSGAILALSFLLRFQGLITCGPLESIAADFSGALAGKVLLEHSSPNKARKARGLLAMLLALFLLSQGWARASCSPLSFDFGYGTRSRAEVEYGINQRDCVKVLSIFAPAMAGILSAFQRSMATRSPLRIIGRKRVHVLSHAIAALVLLPFSLMQIALMAGQGSRDFGQSVIWPLFSTVAFGMVLAFYSNSYSEEKLLTPAYSPKTFVIVTCCIVVLELLYGLDISLAGFSFCVGLLGFGVRELNLALRDLSWEELGDGDSSSFTFSSWVKSPLRHILHDKRSRKIAIFLLINAAFMFVEFASGFLSNSLGLISDACHMLFDCAALVIGLYASYISRLPANSKFIYGYGRFEVVSGYTNAVFLVLVASLIVLESLERILEPQEISTESLLLVSVGGLLVNIIGLIFFHEEHHHAHGTGSCSHSHSLHVADEPGGHGIHSKNARGSVDLCSKASALDHRCGQNIPDVGDGNKHQNSAVMASNKHSGTEHDDWSFTFPIAETAQDHSGMARKQALEEHSPPGMHSHSHHCHENEHSSKSSTDNTASHICVGTVKADSISGISDSSNKHSPSRCEGGHGKDHQTGRACVHGAEDYDKPQHEADRASGLQCVQLDSCLPMEFHVATDSQYEGLVCSKNVGSPGDCGNHGDQHQHCHHQHHDHKHISLHDGSSANNHVSGHGYQHHIDHNHVSGHGHHHHIDHNHDGDSANNHMSGHGHHHHIDHNMQGIFLHVLADTLGSVGVVVSTFLIKYKGWLFMDPACSIFISGLIISSVVPLLRNAAEMLLQRTPRFNERDVRSAVRDIEKLPGVRGCQRMHVWALTSKDVFGSLHLQVAPGSDKAGMQRVVSHSLRGAGIADVTLEVELM